MIMASDSTKENLSLLILGQVEATIQDRCLFKDCPLCGTGIYSGQRDVDDLGSS